MPWWPRTAQGGDEKDARTNLNRREVRSDSRRREGHLFPGAAFGHAGSGLTGRILAAPDERSTDTPLASWVRPKMSMRFLAYWDITQPGDDCPAV